MKKLFYAVAAFALVLTGCAKEIDTQEKDTFSRVRLHVTVADNMTKVSADNDGRYHWQAGDIISVLNDKGKPYDFETADGGSDVDFGARQFEGTLGKYAMYPACGDNEATGDDIIFNIPGEITWVRDANNMPMLGKISEDKATFKSVGGVLKLVCYNIPLGAEQLIFTATNKVISGPFMIDGSEPTPVLETGDGSGGSEQEIWIDFSGNYSENMVFYIPLPTGTIDGFSLSIIDGSANVLYSNDKTASRNLIVARNSMIIAPALNCDPTIVLWRESFTGYSAGTYWSSATEMNVGSGYDAEKLGAASITYKTSGGSTNIATSSNAGGSSPELTITKSGGSFTVNGIPTNGATSMDLFFRENYDDITVSSTSSNVTVSGSFDTKVYTATVSNPDGLSTINLVFTNSTSYDVKFDDPKLYISGKGATIPVITSGNVNLTIAVGSLTKSTAVDISNPVDDIWLSYVLSKKDDKPIDWIESVELSKAEGKLTVTAKDANGEAEDREAILTLKATGAEDKVINLKQTSALVQKPVSISAISGNATFTAQWSKAEHATGYKAYLHTAETATPATGGTELTPSLDGSTYSVTQSGLTNGSTYYLYVKVNTVDANYIAEDAYTMVSFTPENVLYYRKITSAGELESGVKYLIVNEDNSVAFNGGIASSNYDVTSNNVSVSIVDSKIVSNSTTDAASFTITGTTDAYLIRSAAGYYIGRTSTSSGVDASTVTAYNHSITFSSDNAVITDSESGSDMRIRYNASSGQYRFRYYSGDSVQDVQLYKFDDPRAPAGVKWTSDGTDAAVVKAADATMNTGTDDMPAAVLYNPNSLAITYSSSVPSVATINTSTGVITLEGEGSTVITASFPDGDASYRPASVNYTLTVTDSRDIVATPTFSDVTETYPDVNVLVAAKDITISCGTAGATIYYTTDNSAFDPSSWTQSNTVPITGLTTVRAIAVKSDYKNSNEGIVSYRIAGSASPLPAPSGLAVTSITASALTFSWTNDANASDYEWVVSTSSTYAGIVYSGGSANVIDFGDTSDGDCSLVSTKYQVSLSGLSLQGKYYVYVLAKGDGAVYSDSESASTASKGILTLNQTNLGVTASYGDNPTSTIAGFGFKCESVMKNSTNIQGKSKAMYIYNTSTLGKIKTVVVTQSGTRRAETMYSGTDAKPTTTTVSGSTSSLVTTYDFSSSDKGFFNLYNGSGNAMYIATIVIVFE